jgi:hypothetical protein
MLSVTTATFSEHQHFKIYHAFATGLTHSDYRGIVGKKEST